MIQPVGFQQMLLRNYRSGAGLGCAIAVAIFLGLRLFTGLEGPTPEELPNPNDPEASSDRG